MFPRLIRIQLVLFAVASVVGISVMVVNYLQAPMMLGIGRMTVTMQLPDAGGLYRFANVTYRGVQIGKVTEVDVHRGGAVATLSLDTSTPVPSDLHAEVRSVSAVGEQYVDLQPVTDSGPYLRDGAVIPSSAVVVPQQVGPMLDQLSTLVTSIPKDKLAQLLDESFLAFIGAGPDLQTLTDSAARISADADATTDRAVALIEDSRPVLDGQVASADALRVWSNRLAGVSRQLVVDDPQIRTILSTGPAAAQKVSQLLEQVKPTLPILLANMSSLGQVAVTYHAGLEQLLVLLPPAAAMYSSSVPSNNATGIPLGDFRVSVDDPPACTVGFLPRLSGAILPTRPPSTPPTACTANCRRTRPSPFAARATTRAWMFQASTHQASHNARATSRFSRSPHASMRPARTPSTPIWPGRAYLWTGG